MYAGRFRRPDQGSLSPVQDGPPAWSGPSPGRRAVCRQLPPLPETAPMMPNRMNRASVDTPM